jgi:transposase
VWLFIENGKKKDEAKKNKEKFTKKFNLNILRDEFVNSTSEFLKDNDFAFEVPYDCRGEAVREFIQRRANDVNQYHKRRKKLEDKLRDRGFKGKKLKEMLCGAIKYPVPRFKSKKHALKESFYLPAKHWNREMSKREKKPAFEWLKKVKTKEPKPDKLQYDTKVLKDSINRIFLVVSESSRQENEKEDVKINNNQKKDVKMSENQTHPTIKIAAIDPGVRTFATLYDNLGQIFEYGTKDIKRIMNLASHADRLQSKIYKKKKSNGEHKEEEKDNNDQGEKNEDENENNKDEEENEEENNDKNKKEDKDLPFVLNHRRRYTRRRALRKMKCKITDIIKDFHHKVSKHMCQQYHLILLPKFRTSEMTEKTERKISKHSVKQMVTWSHYKFKGIIQSKSQQYNCLVKECTEECTSKTCSVCGYQDDHLGSSKNFNCPSCNSQFDRDFNAAKNIMLKYIIQNMNHHA